MVFSRSANCCKGEALEGGRFTMKPLALIGAGGYVGSRLMERAVLTEEIPLVPIVRAWRSHGRLARYGVPILHGDAGDAILLVPTLRGCGMAVNLTTGENSQIVSNTKSIHAACCEAGVPLLIHMSSAEVSGRAEDPLLSEASVPGGRHWMEYGRAKIAAEAWLRSQGNRPVTVVILRPGLIWGPGSSWLVRPAQALLNGTAFLFNEGKGICNLIHIHNLIEHLLQLVRSGHVKPGTYNIADNETLTWADYYDAIAQEIGINPLTIQWLPDSAFQENRAERLSQFLLNQFPGKAIKRHMSQESKQRIKSLRRFFHTPSRDDDMPRPIISKQMWWIQGTHRKLPTGAFAQDYPEIKLQSFSDLMAKSGEWLRFAGYRREDFKC